LLDLQPPHTQNKFEKTNTPRVTENSYSVLWGDWNHWFSSQKLAAVTNTDSMCQRPLKKRNLISIPSDQIPITQCSNFYPPKKQSPKKANPSISVCKHVYKLQTSALRVSYVYTSCKLLSFVSMIFLTMIKRLHNRLCIAILLNCIGGNSIRIYGGCNKIIFRIWLPNVSSISYGEFE
jgi:hypothetical protein